MSWTDTVNAAVSALANLAYLRYVHVQLRGQIREGQDTRPPAS